ncbi:hypothetical protein CEXT_353111 [Caerostris extrusa]|uniref:Uncharacterized protein n=1 Tax=Caerostris extrusa TaxID=172846 RepID=A0AAV4Q4P2_CAEEX|nr:hypothetical protein CEXT_353111 [Caerostris extrusa]
MSCPLYKRAGPSVPSYLLLSPFGIDALIESTVTKEARLVPKILFTSSGYNQLKCIEPEALINNYLKSEDYFETKETTQCDTNYFRQLLSDYSFVQFLFRENGQYNSVAYPQIIESLRSVYELAFRNPLRSIYSSWGPRTGSLLTPREVPILSRKKKRQNNKYTKKNSVTPPYRVNRRFSRHLRRGQKCLVVRINDLLPVSYSSSVVGRLWTNGERALSRDVPQGTLWFYFLSFFFFVFVVINELQNGVPSTEELVL